MVIIDVKNTVKKSYMETVMLNLNACYIISEIGVNHGGCMNMAKKMIDASKKLVQTQ